MAVKSLRSIRKAGTADPLLVDDSAYSDDEWIQTDDTGKVTPKKYKFANLGEDDTSDVELLAPLGKGKWDRKRMSRADFDAMRGATDAPEMEEVQYRQSAKDGGKYLARTFGMRADGTYGQTGRRWSDTRDDIYENRDEEAYGRFTKPRAYSDYVTIHTRDPTAVAGSADAEDRLHWGSGDIPINGDRDYQFIKTADGIAVRIRGKTLYGYETGDVAYTLKDIEENPENAALKELLEKDSKYVTQRDKFIKESITQDEAEYDADAQAAQKRRLTWEEVHPMATAIYTAFTDPKFGMHLDSAISTSLSHFNSFMNRLLSGDVMGATSQVIYGSIANMQSIGNATGSFREQVFEKYQLSEKAYEKLKHTPKGAQVKNELTRANKLSLDVMQTLDNILADIAEEDAACADPHMYDVGDRVGADGKPVTFRSIYHSAATDEQRQVLRYDLTPQDLTIIGLQKYMQRVIAYRDALNDKITNITYEAGESTTDKDGNVILTDNAKKRVKELKEDTEKKIRAINEHLQGMAGVATKLGVKLGPSAKLETIYSSVGSSADKAREHAKYLNTRDEIKGDPISQLMFGTSEAGAKKYREFIARKDADGITDQSEYSHSWSGLLNWSKLPGHSKDMLKSIQGIANIPLSSATTDEEKQAIVNAKHLLAQMDAAIKATKIWEALDELEHKSTLPDDILKYQKLKSELAKLSQDYAKTHRFTKDGNGGVLEETPFLTDRVLEIATIAGVRRREVTTAESDAIIAWAKKELAAVDPTFKFELTALSDTCIGMLTMLRESRKTGMVPGKYHTDIPIDPKMWREATALNNNEKLLIEMAHAKYVAAREAAAKVAKDSLISKVLTGMISKAGPGTRFICRGSVHADKFGEKLEKYAENALFNVIYPWSEGYKDIEDKIRMIEGFNIYSPDKSISLDEKVNRINDLTKNLGIGEIFFRNTRGGRINAFRTSLGMKQILTQKTAAIIDRIKKKYTGPRKGGVEELRGMIDALNRDDALLINEARLKDDVLKYYAKLAKGERLTKLPEIARKYIDDVNTMVAYGLLPASDSGDAKRKAATFMEESLLDVLSSDEFYAGCKSKLESVSGGTVDEDHLKEVIAGMVAGIPKEFYTQSSRLLKPDSRVKKVTKKGEKKIVESLTLEDLMYDIDGDERTPRDLLLSFANEGSSLGAIKLLGRIDKSTPEDKMQLLNLFSQTLYACDETDCMPALINEHSPILSLAGQLGDRITALKALVPVTAADGTVTGSEEDFNKAYQEVFKEILPELVKVIYANKNEIFMGDGMKGHLIEVNPKNKTVFQLGRGTTGTVEFNISPNLNTGAKVWFGFGIKSRYRFGGGTYSPDSAVDAFGVDADDQQIFQSFVEMCRISAIIANRDRLTPENENEALSISVSKPTAPKLPENIFTPRDETWVTVGDKHQSVRDDLYIKGGRLSIITDKFHAFGVFDKSDRGADPRESPKGINQSRGILSRANRRNVIEYVSKVLNRPSRTFTHEDVTKQVTERIIDDEIDDWVYNAVDFAEELEREGSEYSGLIKLLRGTDDEEGLIQRIDKCVLNGISATPAEVLADSAVSDEAKTKIQEGFELLLKWNKKQLEEKKKPITDEYATLDAFMARNKRWKFAINGVVKYFNSKPAETDHIPPEEIQKINDAYTAYMQSVNVDYFAGGMAGLVSDLLTDYAINVWNYGGDKAADHVTKEIDSSMSYKQLVAKKEELLKAIKDPKAKEAAEKAIYCRCEIMLLQGRSNILSDMISKSLTVMHHFGESEVCKAARKELATADEKSAASEYLKNSFMAYLYRYNETLSLVQGHGLRVKEALYKHMINSPEGVKELREEYTNAMMHTGFVPGGTIVNYVDGPKIEPEGKGEEGGTTVEEKGLAEIIQLFGTESDTLITVDRPTLPVKVGDINPKTRRGYTEEEAAVYNTMIAKWDENVAEWVDVFRDYVHTKDTPPQHKVVNEKGEEVLEDIKDAKKVAIVYDSGHGSTAKFTFWMQPTYISLDSETYIGGHIGHKTTTYKTWMPALSEEVMGELSKKLFKARENLGEFKKLRVVDHVSPIDGTHKKEEVYDRDVNMMLHTLSFIPHQGRDISYVQSHKSMRGVFGATADVDSDLDYDVLQIPQVDAPGLDAAMDEEYHVIVNAHGAVKDPATGKVKAPAEAKSFKIPTNVLKEAKEMDLNVVERMWDIGQCIAKDTTIPSWQAKYMQMLNTLVPEDGSGPLTEDSLIFAQLYGSTSTICPPEAMYVEMDDEWKTVGEIPEKWEEVWKLAYKEALAEISALMTAREGVASPKIYGRYKDKPAVDVYEDLPHVIYTTKYCQHNLPANLVAMVGQAGEPNGLNYSGYDRWRFPWYEPHRIFIRKSTKKD